MTVVLLNYRRPGNIPVILESIRRQTIRPVVFLWNNGPDDVDFLGVDRYEKSGRNVGCMARWELAREADTPYVMSLDDDYCFARDDALEDVVKSLRAMDDPARIIGPVGCRFGTSLSYAERTDVYADNVRTGRGEGRDFAYEAVDMIKGRCMALRRDRIETLELPDEREDDIFLSAAFADGRRNFHRIPGRLKGAFRALPEFGVGNWQRPEHLESRERATAKYFRS
jgi:GT2 family glycosyltransferase